MLTRVIIRKAKIPLGWYSQQIVLLIVSLILTWLIVTYLGLIFVTFTKCFDAITQFTVHVYHVRVVLVVAVGFVFISALKMLKPNLFAAEAN